MSVENLQVAPGTVNPKSLVEHRYKTIGPGIPACSCGTDFEYRYEFDDHKRFYERAEK